MVGLKYRDLASCRVFTSGPRVRGLVASSLPDHFAHTTVAQHFKTYEGKPLTFPAEAAGPKAEYLEYHRSTVFEK